MRVTLAVRSLGIYRFLAHRLGFLLGERKLTHDR
jgi:hypothetical protein